MKDDILRRVRAALKDKEPASHPGSLPPEGERDAAVLFTERFQAGGGEVVSFGSMADAAVWLSDFASQFTSAAVAKGIPESLCPGLPEAPPAEADLGVSMARRAAALTGTMVLDSREGRAVQLLEPVHLVWVQAEALTAGLGGALDGLEKDLPAALGLHSGPSKSSDIGGITVQGVHGPGRVIAALLLPGALNARQTY